MGRLRDLCATLALAIGEHAAILAGIEGSYADAVVGTYRIGINKDLIFTADTLPQEYGELVLVGVALAEEVAAVAFNWRLDVVGLDQLGQAVGNVIAADNLIQ